MSSSSCQVTFPFPSVLYYNFVFCGIHTFSRNLLISFMVEKGAISSPHWTNFGLHKSSVTSFPAYFYNKRTPRPMRDSKLQWEGGNCADACRYRLSVPDVFRFNEVISNAVRLTSYPSPPPKKILRTYSSNRTSVTSSATCAGYSPEMFHWTGAPTQFSNNNFVFMPCCQVEVYFHSENGSGRTTTYVTRNYRNTWHFGGFKPGKDRLAVWTVGGFPSLFCTWCVLF